ncbi:hypothetical protein FA15DRAFT_174158 [Coprinopsis marcescibilis]|uniref:Secreted protein n=1 Tax=Coprinopsis marcescibilis TaxID=230819 RepID=A0A5C3KH33_COPMA|nr:hypothetical protein FA15DRAFT_174158 [Coprinopsis marcescibilis]
MPSSTTPTLIALFLFRVSPATSKVYSQELEITTSIWLGSEASKSVSRQDPCMGFGVSGPRTVIIHVGCNNQKSNTHATRSNTVGPARESHPNAPYTTRLSTLPPVAG